MYIDEHGVRHYGQDEGRQYLIGIENTAIDAQYAADLQARATCADPMFWITLADECSFTPGAAETREEFVRLVQQTIEDARKARP